MRHSTDHHPTIPTSNMKSLLIAAAVLLLCAPDQATAFAPGLSSAGTRVQSAAEIAVGSSFPSPLIGAACDGLVRKVGGSGLSVCPTIIMQD